MTDFFLNERLSADSLPLCHTDMSLLRVSRDGRFPWLILIPQRDGLADLVDLSPDDETRVMAEIRAASLALRAATKCAKLNVASLGNMVRQLHIHIVARFEGDAAWPGPIWGVGEAEPLEAVPDWALDVRSRLGWSA
ncbi:MAG: HIT domain-containing protein [Hyphomicrobiales bacterium]|jgi:diadenosine tetraphosphate (Ap4A) HIT family hydrolase